MNVTVNSDQTIFDLAILAYGDASRAYDLIIENPSLLSSLNDELTGLTLTYTPSIKTRKEAVIIVKSIKKDVTISQDQTLFDLSLQYYGSAESVYQLIAENTQINSLISLDYVGTVLNYTENLTTIPTYFKTNRINIATRQPFEETQTTQLNYLLQEDGTMLLQEDGTGIILE